ncbi:unnamed protein product [Clonostachys solani]|uniref:Uncharacterized protein n=1 Tax=Clonostachys solani TaxID=160281 RepID=A0A9N9ZIW6_9HYPO|nr:unnamed protein product [Clonostachys solani]
MATLTVDEVELTPEVLERFEPQLRTRKWDDFELPDGPLPTLQRFARHGGPDLSDLRFDNYAPNSREKAPIGRAGPSSVRFEGFLTEHNILPLGEDPEGEPLKTHDLDMMETWVKDTLTKTVVPDITVSREGFLLFRQLGANLLPLNVWQGVSHHLCLPRFADNQPSLQTAERLQFSPGASMTDQQTDPLEARFCDGTSFSYLALGVHRQLGALIDPSTNLEGPIAPNFFLETQTPSERPAILRNKARLAGAYGARAIYTLRRHVGDDRDDSFRDGNELLAFTATFADNALKLYGHTAESLDSGRLLFRMRLIASFATDSDVETLQKAFQFVWRLRVEATRLRMAAIDPVNRRDRDDDINRHSFFYFGYDGLNDDDDQAP